MSVVSVFSHIVTLVNFNFKKIKCLKHLLKITFTCKAENIVFNHVFLRESNTSNVGEEEIM